MPLRQRPESCRGCPAFTVGKSFVPGVGPKSAQLALIGSGPGEDEAYGGAPFIGMQGRLLSKWMARAGLHREQVWIDNIVRCWLPNNRPPTSLEVEFCHRTHWRAPLEDLPELRVVVPVGAPASKVLLSSKATNDWAGGISLCTQSKELPWPEWKKSASPEPVLERTVAILPILHPAFVLRGQWAQEPAQVIFLKRASELATSTSALTVSHPMTPPPGTLMARTLDDLHTWETSALSTDGLTVDIETAGDHLVLIGLCDVSHQVPLTVPILEQGGTQYWNPTELVEVVKWLWSLLADPKLPKVFHNGQAFDVPMLERWGFEINGFEDIGLDTMLAQHCAYPGMEKGLEYLAKLYLGSPGWKHIIGQDEGEEK